MVFTGEKGVEIVGEPWVVSGSQFLDAAVEDLGGGIEVCEEFKSTSFMACEQDATGRGKTGEDPAAIAPAEMFVAVDGNDMV